MRESELRKRPHVVAAFVVAVAMGMSLTACGSAEPKAHAPNASDGSPAAMLPSDVLDRGYATIASDATYPPIGFFAEDGKTILGVDADLIHGLSKILGIELREQPASFDSIIPGLQAGKYDFGMSWINHMAEREQVVDFVDYSMDGSSILTLASSSIQPTTPEEMCGLRVAVGKGTVQQDEMTAQADNCKREDKAEIDLQVYPDQSASNLAVISGRVDVTLADTPVAAFQEEQTNGELVVSGPPFGNVYHAIAFPKGSNLLPAVAAAFQELMDSGEYQAILDKWNMGGAAIKNVLVQGKPLS